jgi:GDP-4-dehydro-6-deoxy-D-mannose reductase
MPKALVTGSHGFAGTHLRALLHEREWSVAGLDRVNAAAATGEEFFAADLTDEAAVHRAIAAAAPDVVFHLAGVRGDGSSRALRDVLAGNVLGTVHLFAALRECGRPVRVVHVGSSAEYGAVPPEENPIAETASLRAEDAYGWSKVAAEAVALAHHGVEGIEVVATRPFNHSGPGEPPHLVASAFARQIVAVEAGAEPVIRVGNLDPVRDITDVRDIVCGYLDLAERGTPGRVYNLCSGRGTRIADLLRMLLDKSVASIEVRPDPARQRPSDVPLQVGDGGRARRDVGWAPRIPLENTLADLLADWRSRGGVQASGEGVIP